MKYRYWLIAGIILIACTSAWNLQANPISTRVRVEHQAVMGDLDGDGDTDVLLTHGASGSAPSNTIWINQGGLQGNTQGKLIASAQQLSSQDTRTAALGDLDDDDDLDVLIGNPGGFEVYLNSGGPQGGWQGDFQLKHTHSLSNELADFWRVLLGDLDGDGDLDVLTSACCSGANSIQTWLNSGSADFTNRGQTLRDSAAQDMALGDLDGDGDLDLLMLAQIPELASTSGLDANPAGQVWLNEGGGNFLDSGERIGHARSQVVDLVDLDGDGDLDVLAAGGYLVSIWKNDGAGRFLGATPMTSRLPAQAILPGDLDLDGDLDILLSSGDMVEVWLNDGGAFELSAQRIKLSKYSAAALADLDGDGDLDLFSGFSNERYTIWWNDGFGRLGLSWR